MRLARCSFAERLRVSFFRKTMLDFKSMILTDRLDILFFSFSLINSRENVDLKSVLCRIDDSFHAGFVSI